MNKETTIEHGRITRDPKVMVGKPVIRGTRITVELVLEELAHSPNLEELLADYPELTREDVQAVLGYAQAAVERERAPGHAKRETPGRHAQV